MKPSTQDEVKGKIHEVKGKIKEKVGKATNNPDLENEGTNEKTAGKVQKKIGQVEKFWRLADQLPLRRAGTYRGLTRWPGSRLERVGIPSQAQWRQWRHCALAVRRKE